MKVANPLLVALAAEHAPTCPGCAACPIVAAFALYASRRGSRTGPAPRVRDAVAVVLATGPKTLAELLAAVRAPRGSIRAALTSLRDDGLAESRGRGPSAVWYAPGEAPAVKRVRPPPVPRAKPRPKPAPAPPRVVRVDRGAEVAVPDVLRRLPLRPPGAGATTAWKVVA